MTTKKPRARKRSGPDLSHLADLADGALWDLSMGKPEETRRALLELAPQLSRLRPRPRHRANAEERVAASWARIWHERDRVPIGKAVEFALDHLGLARRFGDASARARAAVRITRLSSERTAEVREFLGIRKLSKK